MNNNPDTGTGGPVARSSSGRAHYCTNWGGTSDDSWSGKLEAGAHSVRVYPYRGGKGNYTITVSGDGAGGIIGYTSSPTPAPEPTPPSPLVCPEIPDFTLPSGNTVNTVFDEATGGTPPYSYGLSGQPPGISFAPATRVASGTLPVVTTDTVYTVTYTCSDDNDETATSTFSATVRAPVRPSAPVLSGSVSGQTQTLTWTAPPGGGITRYQLQTRASAAHAWRFTDAGTPSPSSNIGPSVRSWSMVTPWTLVRHYQVRATNAVGDGAWSNIVELTTPPAPPPPLSVPGIPNFRLPSGRLGEHGVPGGNRRDGTLRLQRRGAAAGDHVLPVNAAGERDAADSHDRDGLHDHLHGHGQRRRVRLRHVRCYRHCSPAPSSTAVFTAAQRIGVTADSVLVLDRSGLYEPDYALSDADEKLGCSRMALHDGRIAVAVLEHGLQCEVMECDHASGPCPPLSGPGDECQWGRCVVQRCRVDLELMNQARGPHGSQQSVL